MMKNQQMMNLLIGILSGILFAIMVREIPGFISGYIVEIVLIYGFSPKGGKGFWIFGGRARSKSFAYLFSILMVTFLIILPLVINPYIEPLLADLVVDLTFGFIIAIGVWFSMNKFFKK